MDICVVLDNDRIIDMFDEINALKDFNSMAKQTKIDIIEGFRKDYSNNKGYIDIDVLIDKLVKDPCEYLTYCDELQDRIVDKINDLKAEYEDLENKIEELQDLSNIVPDTDKYIEQLTDKLSVINSILPLADKLGVECDWKGLANLLEIEF